MHVYKYGRNGDAGIGVGGKTIAPIVSYSFGVKGILFVFIYIDFIMMRTNYSNRHDGF